MCNPPSLDVGNKFKCFKNVLWLKQNTFADILGSVGSLGMASNVCAQDGVVQLSWVLMFNRIQI